MGNLAEIKTVSEKRKAQSPFAQQQQIMNDLPVYFKALCKQMATVSQTMKEQIDLTRKQLSVAQTELQWTEQVHDRLDSLLVENRVTNLLLSELIAMQRVLIPEETDGIREAIRSDAYGKILSGE